MTTKNYFFLSVLFVLCVGIFSSAVFAAPDYSKLPIAPENPPENIAPIQNSGGSDSGGAYGADGSDTSGKIAGGTQTIAQQKDTFVFYLLIILGALIVAAVIAILVVYMMNKNKQMVSAKNVQVR